MKKLAFLAALLFLPACAPVYVPNAVHAPGLREAGDVRISPRLGTDGFGAQAAVALTDHVGLMASVSGRSEEDDNGEDEAPDAQRTLFDEVGAGYFGPLAFSEVLWLGVYGGYGRGEGEATDRYSFLGAPLVESVRGSYQRFFVQAGVSGFRERVGGGLVVRAVVVDFHEYQEPPGPVRRARGAFLEPALAGETGTEIVRLVTQLGLSVPLGSEAVDIEHRALLLSAGLRFNLTRLLR